MSLSRNETPSAAHGRPRRRTRLLVPLALSIFLLGGLAVGRWHGAPIAKAQGQENSVQPPADVMELINALDDLGEMRVVNPLKLSVEQIDKIITDFSAAQVDYQRKLTALAAPSVRKVAQNIRTAKHNALLGNEVASDEAVAKGMKEYLAKRKDLDDLTLKTVSDKIQQILTKTQVATAARIAKEEQAKLTGSEAKGSTAQWFNLYVLRVVIGYPRFVPLLKEMKAARAGEGDKTAGDGNGNGM